MPALCCPEAMNMLRFNTLRKKPKVYNIAVLTLVLLVFLAILRGEEELLEYTGVPVWSGFDDLKRA